MIALEFDPKHAEVARTILPVRTWPRSWSCALAGRWTSLPQLAAEGRGPFDLVFIDADKPVNAADYWAWALKLTRPGSLIITDKEDAAGRADRR